MGERGADRPADAERIRALVHEFATCAVAQTDVFWAESDAEKCNACADRVLAAFKGLCEYRDAGRDAPACLFPHTRADVRSMAAAFLLRHGHAAVNVNAHLTPG